MSKPVDPATKAQSRWWYLYLIETANGALYTGITTDIERRFAQHASGKGARALRGKGPLTLRHVQAVGSHGDALRLEAAIKRLSAAGKRRWIERQVLSSYCHRNVILAEPPTP
ncbi:GIY-YIG nuclease family protein [Salinicola corii]|uniref:GIY-YIG nuclease family protein n=1 Tax=Salinicola corii TaxID=2606937 RepID=A0A640WDD2_9GAMM|nr:GIY-YIG nuclease family protein [Salinicola corii]KAA0017767.1 GIY-YIG nuclease family protein [Salinicola corii]